MIQSYKNNVQKQNDIHKSTLTEHKNKSEIHEYVYESKDNSIVSVGCELFQRNEIEDKINEKPRPISKKFSTK